MKKKYEVTSYSEQEELILNNTELTPEELKAIEEMKDKFKKKAYYPAIGQIFKFSLNKYTTSRIAQIYGVSTLQIQRIIKDLGLNRNKSEAQLILLSHNSSSKCCLKPRSKSKYQKEKKHLLKSGANQIIFPDEVLKYKLDEKVKKEINEKLRVTSGLANPSPAEYSIEEIFNYIYIMLFKLKYTTGEIAECFTNRDLRTVQNWIKYMNWELDRFEAQRRIVDRGKRDYKQIRNKAKETKLKEGIDLHESRPEEYTRKKLNNFLPQILKDSEIIVGLNNISILDKSMEIDIPILVIKNDKVYKFAVEYNGTYWHQNKERDIKKLDHITRKGYMLFSISADGNTLKQRIKQIDEQIELVAAEMIKIVNK